MASPETPLSCKICCGDAADGGPVRCSRQLCFFSGCWGLRCEAQGRQAQGQLVLRQQATAALHASAEPLPA